jgi:hypothetical protein
MNAKADWVLETLTAASAPSGPSVVYPSSSLPASERAWQYFDRGEAAPPVAGEDGLLDFGDGAEDIVASAFWHLSRWEERAGSPRDRHGRFSAASALFEPERPAVDRLLRRFQVATGRGRRDGFTIVLTHDIDQPRRWTSRRTVIAAGGRMRTAAADRSRGALAAEARGLATMPLAVLRRRDPNWSFARMREIEAQRGGRATHFLLAGHHHPADGDAAAYDAVRAEMVDLLLAQGDEVGLHPSYTTSDHPERLRQETARLRALLPVPPRSARFHFLRHDPHHSPAELTALGFVLDSSLGYADRPGLRGGFSFPYRPYDLDVDAPHDLLELPLAVMDATLSDERYLGLDAEAGYLRAVAVLEQVAEIGGTVAILWHNDRFAGPYARGWDRCYERLLDWVVARGGTLCACEDVIARWDAR